MKRFITYVSIGILVFTLGACNEQTPKTEPLSNTNVTGPVDPLLAYEGVSTNHVIRAVESAQAIEQLKVGDGVLILSQPTCSWCQLVMPVIDEVSRELNLEDVYYVDSSLVTSKEEKEALQILVAGNLIVEDEEIILYTPDVYVFKNGEVVGHKLGGVEQSTEEQHNQLKEEYQTLFQLIAPH